MKLSRFTSVHKLDYNQHLKYNWYENTLTVIFQVALTVLSGIISNLNKTL